MLKPYYHSASKVECGCDESGRGCLAGPVVGAAVILSKDFHSPLLNDSKQLSPKTREILRKQIEEEAIAWSVHAVDNKEIDRINILNSSFLAMSKAIENLNHTPQLALIDGNRFKTDLDIEYHCIVKGDSKYQSIAAASILAKTHRDELMQALHNKHPEYNWKQNKGYPTKEHKSAIAQHGITEYHRRSFKF